MSPLSYKTTLVIAGNYLQYDVWCARRPKERLNCLYAGGQSMHFLLGQCGFTRIVFTGTWKERTDLNALMQFAARYTSQHPATEIIYD